MNATVAFSAGHIKMATVQKAAIFPFFQDFLFCEHFAYNGREFRTFHSFLAYFGANNC
jgi:hypothetical protein